MSLEEELADRTARITGASLVKRYTNVCMVTVSGTTATIYSNGSSEEVTIDGYRRPGYRPVVVRERTNDTLASARIVSMHTEWGMLDKSEWFTVEHWRGVINTRTINVIDIIEDEADIDAFPTVNSVRRKN